MTTNESVNNDEGVLLPLWVYLLVAFTHGAIPGLIIGFVLGAGRAA